MLNTSDWKEFLLSDIFDIRKGKRLTKENQTMGDTPFIGATAKNNGITSYIGQEYLHEGNTISLTYNGSVGEAFYQPKPFWASDDVNVLYPKDFVLTENIALFFCAILRLEKQMWSYARKWNLEKMNDTSIRLPVNSCNEPNYGMIETYMAGLKADITNIPDYFLNEGYEKASWYLDNLSLIHILASLLWPPGGCRKAGNARLAVRIQILRIQIHLRQKAAGIPVCRWNKGQYHTAGNK